MAKVLISDAIAEEALEVLEAEGIEYDYIPDITMDDLKERIVEYDG